MSRTRRVHPALCLFASLVVCAPLSAGEAALRSIPLAADQPRVEEVLDSAVKAVGGRTAVDRVKTLHAVFEMDFGDQKIVNDTKWSRAGGRLSAITTPGLGDMEMGTDGKIRWRRTPMGYAVLKGRDSDQFEGQVNLFMIVLEPHRLAEEEVASIDVAGTESFAGAECRRVHYVGRDGREGDVFFAVRDGLPVGMRQVEQTPRGEAVSVVLLKDWKEEAGVRFFRTMSVESAGAGAMPPMPPMTLRVTRLEVNTVNEDAFALPPEVLRLAQADDDEPPAAGEIRLSDLTPAQQAQATEIIEGIKRAGSAAPVRSTISSLEQAARYAPQEQKKMYEYVVQELKKYAARLEGGG